MELPAPFPRGRGPRSPVYTSVRTLTNRARPRPQNFAPPRSWIRSSTHGRVYVRSPYFPDFLSARAVTYGYVLQRPDVAPQVTLSTACDFAARRVCPCLRRWQRDL